MKHSCSMSSQARFFRVSKLRRLCATEQVAAVCYRVRGGEIEFLLVQTGGGRWIFPKGGVEPGLNHAQAAAIEAFEEAGVHGRIEEAAFAAYRIRNGGRSSRKQLVSAHLCEVLRLGPCQERGRNRTWFSAREAKQRLQEDRKNEDARELQRVIARAAARINQSRRQGETPLEVAGQRRGPAEPLQQVQFEANGLKSAQINALYLRYIRHARQEHVLADGEFSASKLQKPVPRLSAANPPARPENVTAIDAARSKGGK